ncbi:MAG TPA: alpha/beta fold hydrolase [Myxococcales bacterium]|jgi:pimeloyl-ACP methyl ester carboxylesterase
MRVWFAVLAISCHAARTAPLPLSPCTPKDSPQPLQCGRLSVPENRSNPSGRFISIQVAVVPATGERTSPPLYDFAGGPGISEVASAGYWLTDGAIHRRHRDVVLVDQRGTGGSAFLDCPELSLGDASAEVFPDAAVESCRARLSQNADLAHYSTAETVADVDAVRAALGHDRIDISGLSYGSRVAQEYLRAHPDRVRAAVLLGAVSPEVKLPLTFAATAEETLEALARQCARDPDCHAAVPDLMADVRGIAAPPQFWEALRAQMITTDAQRRLPWLLHRAASGERGPLLEAMSPHPDGASTALLLAVECPEDTLRATGAERATAAAGPFGDYRLRRQTAACRIWGVPPLPDSRPSFVTGDVPVLLLAGEMDSVTPPRWAEEIARHLRHARVVTIPNLGHFPAGLSHMECYDQIIAQFFEAGSAEKLDTSCIQEMRPPPFSIASH